MASDNDRDEIDQNGNLRMICGSFYIAKDRESKPQGDDSHFICEEKQTTGVADGVGGWSKKGVDAGLYARKLINNSLLTTLTQSLIRADPMKVLDEAFLNTTAEGSSTACIITIQQENNKLHAVNMEDGGFMVIRQGKPIYKSPIQLHSFNRPFQLGNSPRSDKPWEAQVIKVAVEPGDVISGTDGLFDNLSETQILEAASKGIGQGLHPEEIAWHVAQQAYHISIDKQAVTPFSSSRADGKCYVGGEPDNITVIVLCILHKAIC